MAAQTIEWKGKSGQAYTYHLYNIGTQMDPVPANYIFAKATEPNRFRAIYIGQTGDISERFDNHHKMPSIKKEGATHVCTHKSSTSETERQAEESDLIANYKPISNG